jgi:hypothetical protein
MGRLIKMSKKISLVLITFLYFVMAFLTGYGETMDYSVYAQTFAESVYQLCNQEEPDCWENMPLFRHGESVEHAIVRKDGKILIQINQSSFDHDAIVTDYSIMVDRTLENAQEEMNRLTGYVTQAVFTASNQPYANSYSREMIEKNPNRVIVTGVSKVRAFGNHYLTNQYRYTGSLPSSVAFLKEQSIIDYNPCEYDRIQENRLFLQELLQVVFPDNTFDDIEEYCTNGIVDGIKHMGELHGDSYIFSNGSDELRVYVWHKQNESIDEKTVTSFEFYSSSTESEKLMERYLSIFSSLPGVQNSLLQVLPFIHGDEFTWTSYLEIPAIQCGNWEMNLVLSGNQKQPIARYQYIP